MSLGFRQRISRICAATSTFAASATVTTIEGAKQVIALGPVASQLAIKMLGTNGGGFFNANSAHPFENPSALVNLIQMLSIFVLGAGLTLTFGKAVRNVRQGWALLAAMVVIFLIGVGVTYWAEAAGNPLHHALGLVGGNMEGKEVRFGVAATALFAVVTRQRHVVPLSECMIAFCRWQGWCRCS